MKINFGRFQKHFCGRISCCFVPIPAYFVTIVELSMKPLAQLPLGVLVIMLRGTTTLKDNDIQHNDIQPNDIQPNDIQPNDTQHKGLLCDTQHK
jgi:hypothetical protein